MLPQGLLGERGGGGGPFPPEALASGKKEHFFQRSVCGEERLFSVDYTRNVCYFCLHLSLNRQTYASGAFLERVHSRAVNDW